MSHWGYVLEQIAQGDERTRVVTGRQRRRRIAVAAPRWWTATSRHDVEPVVTPVRTLITPSAETTCARAAAVARGALA